jgi:hypothetical protein
VQGKAGGVQGAGILRRDHHSAVGGAGAAGVGKEAKERAGVRLEGRRAGAKVRKEIGGRRGFGSGDIFSLEGLPGVKVITRKMSNEGTPGG